MFAVVYEIDGAILGVGAAESKELAIELENAFEAKCAEVGMENEGLYVIELANVSDSAGVDAAIAAFFE